MPDPLQQLKAYLSTDYHGCLGVGGVRVFLRDGRIVQASCDRDWMWLLRRLRCSGWLRGGEASLLGPGRINSRLLPHVPGEVFQQLLADRARQNLFSAARRNALLAELGGDLPADGPLSSSDPYALLRSLAQNRAALFPLWSRLGKLWVRKTGSSTDDSLLSLCNPGLPLAELVARSPFEELDTLVRVQKHTAAGAMSVGSQHELEDMTDEESSLFADRDRLRSPMPQQPSRWVARELARDPAELLGEANAMLEEMGRGCSKSPRDWLLGLIGTAPAVQKVVWASISVDETGLLRQQGPVGAGALEPAVHHLLVRAARSPTAKRDRRKWLAELGRWEDRWHS